MRRGAIKTAKAFGLFVELDGFRRQGLVHFSAISADVQFSREDDDASKAKALDYMCVCASSAQASACL